MKFKTVLIYLLLALCLTQTIYIFYFHVFSDLRVSEHIDSITKTIKLNETTQVEAYFDLEEKIKWCDVKLNNTSRTIKISFDSLQNIERLYMVYRSDTLYHYLSAEFQNNKFDNVYLNLKDSINFLASLEDEKVKGISVTKNKEHKTTNVLLDDIYNIRSVHMDDWPVQDSSISFIFDRSYPSFTLVDVRKKY